MSKTATLEPSAPVANRKPIVSKRFGRISVGVFLRDVTTPAGKTFRAKDFVLQRSWKDKQGNWQDQSITLSTHDILAVHKALDEAFIESYSADDDEE